MSILIKGMEMPTDNTVLLRIYPEIDGVIYVEQLDIDDDILDKYWAVPVPEHGPLVDTLEVINTFPEGFIFTNEQARALTNYIIPADPAEEGE